MPCPSLRVSLLLITGLASGFCAADVNQQYVFSSATELHSKSPLPPSEWELSNVVAERVVTVSDRNVILEGPSFTRQGDLVFSDSTDGHLMRLSRDKKLSRIAAFDGLTLGGTAIHRDGRIFVTVIKKDFSQGWIVSMQADGTDKKIIVPPDRGFIPNDIVFDKHGGFYFSDFRGSAVSGDGGAYYVSPDEQNIIPVLQHLSRANGIALSPDEATLWITEHAKNRLIRADLSAPTTIKPLGTYAPYSFTGTAPDSLRTDSNGNIYVAMMRQGRVLVFAPNGVPFAQILMPDRARGHNLATASLALSPDKNELYVVAGDLNGGGGAAIFRAPAFGHGKALFSHR